MSSPYYLDDRATPAFSHQRFIPDSSTSPGSYLLSLVIGACVLFKSLEYLGYPVWLWLHQLLQMATDSIPLNLPLSFLDSSRHSPAGDPDSSDSPTKDMQNRGGSLLSSVFGLNSGGLIGKGVRGVTGALSKSYRNVPPGLGNWDNSCYQNSVIQGLASLPSLQDHLARSTAEYSALDGTSTNGALLDLINKLNDPGNHGQQFWIRGSLKSMSTFQQQDAQEYYSKILEALDSEIQNASNSKRRTTASWISTLKSLSDLQVDTANEEQTGSEYRLKESPTRPQQPQVIPNPLQGQLAQRVGCVNCGFTEGLSLIPFNCITVPLGRNRTYDVRDCLDESTGLECIEGVECAKCTLLKMKNALIPMKPSPDSALGARLQAVQEALDEEDFDDKTLIKKCGILKRNWVQSTKSRQAVIARAPKAFVLHVNRSIFDEMTGAQLKNDARVSYPKFLDLGNWCLGKSPSRSQQQDESIEESWPRDPTKSLLGDADSEPTTDSPFQYVLRAAITHFGNHGNGHYICYRQHPFRTAASGSDDINDVEQLEHEASHEQWWRLSDDNVFEVSEEEAVRQENVFMLFYERIDPNSTPLPPSQAQPIESSITVPLPPASISSDVVSFDDTAAEIPLPEDDFESFYPSPPTSPHVPQLSPDPSISSPELVLPESSQIRDSAADRTPPPHYTPRIIPHEDTDMSEADTTNYDSEDAPSTQLTSDDDAEMDEEPPKEEQDLLQLRSHRPHMMRTAGDVGGDGGRMSLPMVTAL